MTLPPPPPAQKGREASLEGAAELGFSCSLLTCDEHVTSETGEMWSRGANIVDPSRSNSLSFEMTSDYAASVA